MTFDPKEAKALVKQLLAFAWDYPCVHCGSPVLESNGMGQIICVMCLNENPADVRSETICKSADALAAALDEIERLHEALTPSSETKTAYISEVECDCPTETWRHHVPWTSVKAVMAMIRKRAALKGADQ